MLWIFIEVVPTRFQLLWRNYQETDAIKRDKFWLIDIKCAKFKLIALPKNKMDTQSTQTLSF